MESKPSGADVRRQVLGAAHVARTSDPTAFMAPFYELSTEHAWGGAWVRPGLDLKHRSLVVVSVLIALGRTHELGLHLRGALNVGWTAEELREVCLQTTAYAGYPAALDALRVLQEIVAEHSR
jgi:4-carboxymuconolactone decarboxylase